MPSIKDIAEVAGVSVTTVSLVLNNKGNISSDTRTRVLQVVEEMGYTRNVRAQSLREQRSRIIGYAQNPRRGQDHPLYDHFLYEVVRLVEAQGRHILLFHTDIDNQTSVYRDLIRSQRVDGFILSYTDRDDERFSLLHNELQSPFVAFGRSLSPLDDMTHWVDVDGEVGLFLATEHLIKRGHRRIAIIAWPTGSACGDTRYQGYVEALEEYQINYDPQLLRRVEDDIVCGYRCAQEFMEITDPPTAVVALTDTLAVGAMQYFNETGRPVAVTGFDDTPMAAVLGLTSLRQPVQHIARLLSDMLLAQLDGDPIEHKQHLLKPELVIRSSSKVND